MAKHRKELVPSQEPYAPVPDFTILGFAIKENSIPDKHRFSAKSAAAVLPNTSG
jgi:hypothetical protein